MPRDHPLRSLFWALFCLERSRDMVKTYLISCYFDKWVRGILFIRRLHRGKILDPLYSTSWVHSIQYIYFQFLQLLVRNGHALDHFDLFLYCVLWVLCEHYQWWYHIWNAHHGQNRSLFWKNRRFLASFIDFWHHLRIMGHQFIVEALHHYPDHKPVHEDDWVPGTIFAQAIFLHLL